MRNVQDGSSTEVDELKAKLASTKETLQGEIKVRQEVRNAVKQFNYSVVYKHENSINFFYFSLATCYCKGKDFGTGETTS